ncbi:YbhB/YbcL family Raf kinase inhibitor-like protein [Litchfieldella xinjiangensis]|uniref:YbhB/YbcL family Raf kinase inhibitor-like protein n=1 Tax=Litchfieldella xinjiangensis TaxID=1166948 RepID=UPI0005BA3E3E|nr:YbhB/YbcL family Raf kinase inhibitor-like protein [Halomonas xinjiangensis]
MAFALSSIKLESEAFEAQDNIPTKHSAEGQDVSPALRWSEAPEGTQAFAVICHDPDAPLVQNGLYGFVHWVLYNLPASTTSLEEGTQAGTAGNNDFGNVGYGGPMPPEGHGLHRYYFWILALDKQLDLPEGLSLGELLSKVEPHLLGMNRLVGTYQRD